MSQPRFKPGTSEYKSGPLTPALTGGRTFKTVIVIVAEKYHENLSFCKHY
jgi:hypothetical protein